MKILGFTLSLISTELTQDGYHHHGRTFRISRGRRRISLMFVNYSEPVPATRLFKLTSVKQSYAVSLSYRGTKSLHGFTRMTSRYTAKPQPVSLDEITQPKNTPHAKT